MKTDRPSVLVDLPFLRAPWLWPHYPFVQVERRSEMRPGQPYCVVFADETSHVVPAVFFVPSFPPCLDEFDPERSWGFSYPDLDAVINDGWRVV